MPFFPKLILSVPVMLGVSADIIRCDNTSCALEQIPAQRSLKPRFCLAYTQQHAEIRLWGFVYLLGFFDKVYFFLYPIYTSAVSC